MRRFAILLGALGLAACAQADEAESAEDFAARIDSGDSADSKLADTPAAPAGADAVLIAPVGDTAEVDLGIRDGGCTFTADGVAMLAAAGANERTLPGKAVVSVGGEHVVLDGSPGGLEKVRQGSEFAGETITATVSVAGAGEGATLTIAGADGTTQTFNGKWSCA